MSAISTSMMMCASGLFCFILLVLPRVQDSFPWGTHLSVTFSIYYHIQDGKGGGVYIRVLLHRLP
jgi:hypothetical protein